MCAQPSHFKIYFCICLLNLFVLQMYCNSLAYVCTLHTICYEYISSSETKHGKQHFNLNLFYCVEFVFFYSEIICICK